MNNTPEQDRIAALTHRELTGATNTLVALCHHASAKAGWWNAPDGTDLRSNPAAMKALVGWKLALIHSEVSEATEGIRKDKMDEHLPQYSSGAVELADAIIRIADLAGALGYNLGAALADKIAYNAVRPDHKLAARAAAGGKEY